MRLTQPSGVTRRQLALSAASLLLTRCASVPEIGRLAAKDIGLHRGSESASKQAVAQTAADPDALQQQYDIQRALSEAPLVSGNNIKLLSGGEQAFAAMFSALSRARSSINMEYFILANVVSAGVPLSDVLLDRLAAGVRVNLIYDGYGSADTPPAFFDTLRKAGAKVLEFHPLNPLNAGIGWSPNDRDHRKIMVVDGKIAFTGGINLDKAYENPPQAGAPADHDSRHAYWKDVAVRIEGPAVAELQKLFFGTWTEQKGPEVGPADYYPPLARVGVQTIRIIGSSPSNQRPLYYASLLAAVESARNRIWLCTGYFVPPHEEREVLAHAARAGRDVRITAPAFSDVEAAVYAGRAAYGDLLEAGAKIYEVRDAVLHAKLAVVDDTWTVIGSSNLDRRSVVFNQEVDAVILGHDAAAQAEAILRGYMADAREVTPERWAQRSLSEHVREVRARIWQYWM